VSTQAWTSHASELQHDKNSIVEIGRKSRSWIKFGGVLRLSRPAEIETPNASRRKGMGRGYPLLSSRLGCLGERHEIPQCGVRAEPRPITSFGAFRAWKNTSDSDKLDIVSTPHWVRPKLRPWLHFTSLRDYILRGFAWDRPAWKMLVKWSGWWKTDDELSFIVSKKLSASTRRYNPTLQPHIWTNSITYLGLSADFLQQYTLHIVQSVNLCIIYLSHSNDTTIYSLYKTLAEYS